MKKRKPNTTRHRNFHEAMRKLPPLEAVRLDPSGILTKEWAVKSDDPQKPLTEKQALEVVARCLAVDVFLSRSQGPPPKRAKR